MATEVSSSASELRERIGSLSISQSSEEAKFTAPQNSTREFTIRRHHPTLGIMEKTFKGRFAECLAQQEIMTDLSTEKRSSEDCFSRGTSLILPCKEVLSDKKLKQREFEKWMAEILLKEKFEASTQGGQGSA